MTPPLPDQQSWELIHKTDKLVIGATFPYYETSEDYHYFVEDLLAYLVENTPYDTSVYTEAPFYIKITIEEGVIIKGPIVIKGFNSMSTFEIINHGEIKGTGGKGGTASTPYHLRGYAQDLINKPRLSQKYWHELDGQDGGDCIHTYHNLVITNYGKIHAGGGGGAGGTPVYGFYASNKQADNTRTYLPLMEAPLGNFGNMNARFCDASPTWNWPSNSYYGPWRWDYHNKWQYEWGGRCKPGYHCPSNPDIWNRGLIAKTQPMLTIWIWPNTCSYKNSYGITIWCTGPVGLGFPYKGFTVVSDGWERRDWTGSTGSVSKGDPDLALNQKISFQIIHGGNGGGGAGFDSSAGSYDRRWLDNGYGGGSYSVSRTVIGGGKYFDVRISELYKFGLALGKFFALENIDLSWLSKEIDHPTWGKIDFDAKIVSGPTLNTSDTLSITKEGGLTNFPTSFDITMLWGSRTLRRNINWNTAHFSPPPFECLSIEDTPVTHTVPIYYDDYDMSPLFGLSSLSYGYREIPAAGGRSWPKANPYGASDPYGGYNGEDFVGAHRANQYSLASAGIADIGGAGSTRQYSEVDWGEGQSRVDDPVWRRDPKKLWSKGGGSDAMSFLVHGIYNHDYLKDFKGDGGAGGNIGEDGKNTEVAAYSGTSKLGQPYTLPAITIKGGKGGHAIKKKDGVTVSIKEEGDIKGRIEAGL
jgi:hypothetical protein